MKPYTRSLHPDDYAFLPHTERLREFVCSMSVSGVPHRAWHQHRVWEYASIMQQLDELGVPKESQLVDVGSGASFFPPYLTTLGGYPNVTLVDSMQYGDITSDVQAQRAFYGVQLPLLDLPVEDMQSIPSDCFDVTMCISTIEHVDVSRHDDALKELHRITKPGGLIFITSDYFRDLEQFERSPSRHLQQTPYTKYFVLTIPTKIDATFVGETDLAYQGDFVHDAYSFVNICLRKAG